MLTRFSHSIPNNMLRSEGTLELLVRDLQETGKEPLWECSEDLLSGLNGVCPDEVQTILKGVSQWGLKEVWLGQKIGDHDRWKHSQGVLAVTVTWLSSLYASGRIKWHPWPLRDEGQAIRLAGMAALLHDFGHLPFAHLLAEVLESVNWVPRGAGQAGMEGFVLRKRLDRNDIFKETWSQLATMLEIESADAAKNAVQDLIIGQFGIPWIQAILNSAVDADKIDYLCRDSWFLRDAGWPITSRMSTQPKMWLEEFLTDQHITHAGLLCLDGRSAVAAADLLRERIFLHDRFYLSPELRVAERMAFEILQQFLLRVVMSDGFRSNIQELSGFGYSLRFLSDPPVDPIEAKGRLVAEMMESLAGKWASRGDREFGMLEKMYQYLLDSGAIDNGYLDLLKECFKKLKELHPPTKKSNIHGLAKTSLVREPLVFHRKDYATARDALRPVQHKYSREILIDIAKLPRVLAMPGRWRGGQTRGTHEDVDYGILVPDGPVSSWGPGSNARVPLTDRAVSQLERPYGRVIVITPFGHSARVEYLWDRVRSVLLEAGVKLQPTGTVEVV
jgi:hypothetical protein